MKKLLTLTFILMFALNATAFAAVSSSKPKSSSPAPKAPTTQTTPQAAPDQSSGYKPSAPSSSYNEKAPAAKTQSQAAATQTAQPQSGGFMRSLATFGGGMLLGGLLGSMFGANSMMADLIGALFNVMLLAGVFMAVRYFWNQYKEKKELEKKRDLR